MCSIDAPFTLPNNMLKTSVWLFRLINARSLIYLFSRSFARGSFSLGALNELEHLWCLEMKVFLAGIWVFLVQEIIFFREREREGKGRERQSESAMLLKSGY